MRPQKAKARSTTQIMESTSERILLSTLPAEWVIHEYKPDYGIDYSVEIFGETTDADIYETFGEHFFIQLKSKKHIEFSKVTLYPEFNPLLHGACQASQDTAEKSEEAREIDVIKFSIESSLLHTVRKMSPVAPLLLFLICLQTENIYYICINDYIDKILIPRHNFPKEEKSKTIFIPATNILPHPIGEFELLQFYAKRPKLYYLFSLAQFYDNELKKYNYENLALAKYALESLLSLDIWNYYMVWQLPTMYQETATKLLAAINSGSKLFKKIPISHTIFEVFSGMTKMVFVFEDLVRLWALPQLTSVLLDE